MNGKRRSATTHIAAGSRVVGDIAGTTDLIVEGHIEGTLEMKNAVVIGRTGVVDGAIRARTVRVSGTVNGNVTGYVEIEILPQGKIEGDVTAPRLAIAEGGYFKGNVEMDGPKETKR